MTKFEALQLLDDYVQKSFDNFGQYKFPINDEVAYFKMNSEEIKNMKPNNVYVTPITCEQYTFKHLIKIAYDLKDKE
jgi:hypothetical protein